MSNTGNRPHLRLIVTEQSAKLHREKMQRQAELKQFIARCEALYEKNRAKSNIIYLQENRP